MGKKIHTELWLKIHRKKQLKTFIPLCNLSLLHWLELTWIWMNIKYIYIYLLKYVIYDKYKYVISHTQLPDVLYLIVIWLLSDILYLLRGMLAAINQYVYEQFISMLQQKTCPKVWPHSEECCLKRYVVIAHNTGWSQEVHIPPLDKCHALYVQPFSAC